MEKLEFNPKTGWLDTASFPNKQGEQANRNMLNNLHMQTRDFINKLVEDLETATEDRGSALIGAYAIEGLLNEDGTDAITVQQQINALKKLLDSNDTSLNDEIVVIKEDLEALDTKVEGYNTTLDEKIDSSVETLDTRIDSEVETLNESIDLKANSNDVYTKTETNEKLDAKSDKSDVYTRNDVDTLLATKSDLSNVYTKDAIDSKVDMQHGALASLNDIFSGGGNIQIEGGVGIAVAVDNLNKRIIVNATGEAQPGAHALSHTIYGTDPIQSKELFYGDNTLEEVVEGIKSDVATKMTTDVYDTDEDGVVDKAKADASGNDIEQTYATKAENDLGLYGEQSGGKNLLQPTLSTTTKNGVTCTNNGDGTYTLNGTTNTTSYFAIGKVYLSKGLYKIIGTPKNRGNSSLYWAEDYHTDLGDGSIINISDDNTEVTLIIVTYAGTYNNVLFKPMLTTDLNATYDDFVPYIKSNKQLTDDSVHSYELSLLGRVFPTLPNGVKNTCDGSTFVQRIGCVDLGCLAFRYARDNFTFYVTVPEIKAYDRSVNANCFVTLRYSNQSIDYMVSDRTKDKMVGVEINHILAIRDLTYGNTDKDDVDGSIAKAFKQAMLGTYLYYELATPITYSVLDNQLHYDNAGSHNSIYQGKYLGSSATPQQYSAIKNGTFENLNVGDYWFKDGIYFRIGALDYFLNTGDVPCTEHHALIVPDTKLYDAQMNDTNTTSGAYVGSKMYTSGLEQAKTIINNAFSGHVLSHRVYLNNATTNGYVSGGLWVNSTVELMNENMLFGGLIFSPVSDGTNIPNNSRVEKTQLPLFQFRPNLISNRTPYYLRDVVSTERFAIINSDGCVSRDYASASYGVRPYFCIKG